MMSIDPSSWDVAVLPLPKRFTRAKALGFCGGHAVGMVESSRGKSQACWWPGDQPELLSLGAYKELQALSARDDRIAGSWSKGSSGARGAVVWRLNEGMLVGTDLHDRRFEQTWAECAEHRLVLGVGVHKGRLGARPPDSGLVWRDDGTCIEVPGPEDVCLRGTDGTRLVGSIGGRGALWPAAGEAAVDLAPPGFISSEVYAIDGDTQVGIVFKGITARAALWKGSADSFADLTPADYQVSRAFHASDGWQVGFVRQKDVTRNGSSNLADQAALWQGSSDRWIDLNALLPAESGWNASVAWSIEWRDDRLQICGEASQYEVSDPGTDRESHFVPAAQAVIWRARRQA